jgi:hypothetical protein
LTLSGASFAIYPDGERELRPKQNEQWYENAERST